MDDNMDGVTRRGVLRTTAVVAGTGLLGGGALTGTAAGASDCGADWSLGSMIPAHGHYAYFPLGPDSWGRQKSRYALGDGDSRWSAQPTSNGGVRCRVEELPEGGNAGFDLHVGPLGNVHEFTLETRTVSTASGSSASLFVGLYLDVDGDGDFFAWNDGRGAAETWAGFGPDAEGAVFLPADGTVTIDDSTTFQLFHVASSGEPDESAPTATLADLKGGSVSGADGSAIDGGTEAAFYVGVMSGGGGTEEVVVESAGVRTPDAEGRARPLGRPGDAVADEGNSTNFETVGEAAEDDINQATANSEMTDCMKAAFDRLANRDDI